MALFQKLSIFVQNYDTVCYPVTVNNLLCKTLDSGRKCCGIFSEIYLPFLLHKNYNGSTCFVSIRNDN